MRHSVLINLDRPRNIRLDTNSLVKAEELLKKSVTSMGQDMGIREMRALLWVGLTWEDRRLTLDDVGKLIDEAGFDYVFEKLSEALTEAFGSNEEAGEAKN